MNAGSISGSEEFGVLPQSTTKPHKRRHVEYCCILFIRTDYFDFEELLVSFSVGRTLISNQRDIFGIKMASKTKYNLNRKKVTSQATIKQVECAVAEASNNFGIHLYYLLAKENTNVFFSPFSISTALAMLFCGAQKETAKEMREVLGYEAVNIKDEELKSCFQKLLDALDSNQESYTLNCANAVLSNKEFSVKEEYKSLLEHFFNAFFKEVDFVNESDEAVKLVNEWFNKKTNNMIPNILDSLDPSTVLIILNAVYFKGYWSYPFEEDDTNPQDFYNKGDKNNCRQVDMMHIRDIFLYTKKESYKALELPYEGGNISMLILLPNSKDGLSELESSLSSTFIQDLEQSMSETKVEVALPKFKLEYSTSLKEKFQSLGLSRVFNNGAHLNAINDSDELFLSEVNHTAILVVNEEGSEAVAFTGMKVSGSRAPMEQAKFIVDHSFMFVIYNVANNLILFMGRVDNFK
ncbi:putative serpin-like protein TK1782 [Araneus ventricosus]|uniref:Putative serpin-like protein TK1782 n=1 Tax=Araneus ventricosus TaxID=182803 RepID=A0A4Y2E8K1_ARAVE|nr:putative serpin-like protein TK1782 [Araneus ventricosus]